MQKSAAHFTFYILMFAEAEHWPSEKHTLPTHNKLCVSQRLANMMKILLPIKWLCPAPFCISFCPERIFAGGMHTSVYNTNLPRARQAEISPPK